MLSHIPCIMLPLPSRLRKRFWTYTLTYRSIWNAVEIDYYFFFFSKFHGGSLYTAASIFHLHDIAVTDLGFEYQGSMLLSKWLNQR